MRGFTVAPTAFGPSLLAGLAMAFFLAGPAAAEEKLTGAQIREVLTGNTVAGVWAGQPYKAYFRPDGLTLHQPEGGEEESGRWRIDEGKDQYCSWWAHSGWSCYNLYRDGRSLIWEVPGSGERYSSRIITPE